MKTIALSTCLIPLLVAAGGVHAQQVQPAQPQVPLGPDNGFFRPAPDVSLTAPRIPANVSAPLPTAPPPYVTIQAAQAMPAAEAAPPSVPAAAVAADQQAQVERQMDRSVEEAQRDRVRMQAATSGVGAAFDGTTSERDR
jgi:hypothetical protein